jgi:GTPase SAR1 family protein
MRYAVLVTGPAGAGKSTFCASFMTHLQTSKRSGHLVNLDPAAAPDSFEYAPSIDIKDLISVDDVMSELGYGPNGGLVYCFEYVSAPFTPPERRGRAFSAGAQIPLAEYGLARGGSRRI